MNDNEKKYIEDFIKYCREDLSFIDPNFFDGIGNIFEHISDKYGKGENSGPIQYSDPNISVFTVEDKVKECAKEELSPEEQLKRAEEFYHCINEELGKMAHDAIEGVNKTIKDDSNPNQDLDPNALNLVLEGNNYSVIITVHELAHRFTLKSSDPNYKRGKGETELVNIFMSETPSILMEMFCQDFIQEKYGEKIPKDIERTKGVLITTLHNNFLPDQPTSAEKFKIFSKLMNKAQMEDLNEENYSEYKEMLVSLGIKDFSGHTPEDDINLFIMSEEHSIATIYARYMYQQIQKDPKCFSLLYASLYCNSLPKGFVQEQIDFFEKLGLPLFKNGKMIVDTKSFEALTSSFDEYMQEENPKLPIEKISEAASNLDEMHSMGSILSETIKENGNKNQLYNSAIILSTAAVTSQDMLYMSNEVLKGNNSKESNKLDVQKDLVEDPNK